MPGSLRSQVNLYWNVIWMAAFGFAALAAGLYLLMYRTIPGGLLFIGGGLFLFYESHYQLKVVGTDQSGRTHTVRWEEMPPWKKKLTVALIVIFFVLLIWLFLDVPGQWVPGWEDDSSFWSSGLP